MAHPLALSYVVALLIASADASLQIEAKAPDESDCELGECYGVDMFPEKLGPLIPDHDRKAAPKSENSADSDNEKMAGTENADLKRKDEGRMHFPLEEMRLLLAKQNSQMERFDLLEERLQKLMDRLETGLLHSSEIAGPENGRTLHVMPMSKGRKSEGVSACSGNGRCSSGDHFQEEMDVQKMEKVENFESSASSGEIVQRDQHRHDHEYIGGITVARYKPSWSEHFQFLSAVKVDGEITCLHVLPQEGDEGLSKYIAAGVDSGRIYIFLPHGDLLLDFQTASNLPITAILSYSVRRNETAILTGHSDGSVLIHTLWEMRRTGPLLGDEWSTLSMEHMHTLSIPKNRGPLTELSTADEEPVKQSHLQGSIRILEAYRIGRLRYVLASDSEGNIEVFRDNGTFYGTAKASSQPLAFFRSPNLQRLLFLTDSGVSTLDLRSLAVRNGPCAGLDGSKAVSYTFDATGRPKAYGFTDEGHMIYVALSGDTLHFECHVRSKRKLDMGNNFAAQGIKGYLLVVTPTQILVYNTTLQAGHSFNSISVGPPRLLIASSLDDIFMPFLNGPIKRKKMPVIACNRERLVVLGFGDGYVIMYKSYLPVQSSKNFSDRTWSSPVIIIVLMFLGSWYFFWKKRDASISTSDFDMAMAPSSTGTLGYTRAGMDAALDSRRYAGHNNTFAGSPASSYSSPALKYRSAVTEQRFRTPVEEPFLSSTTVEPSLRNPSLEPYFQKDLAESKFQASKLETSFKNPLLDSDPYAKRELDLKASRSSSSMHPRIRRLQEPNSF